MKKIKIIFIHHKLVCGGAEQALFDLISLMDKEKFDITVFVQKDDGEWNEKFWNAGIRVVFDYSCRKPSWNPVVKVGNLLKKWQISQASADDGKGLMDLCCPGADIIVSYGPIGYPYIGFAQGAKAVHYIHGDVSTNKHYRRILQEKAQTLPNYDKIVCVSEKAREAFCKETGLNETVCMYHNPLNSAHVKELAKESVDIPVDAPVICAVGRLSAEKGFDRLLYIHRRLLDQGICHHLLIVGDGEDWELLQRMRKTMDLEDSVTMVGYQSNPYPYMRASKFLVNASYTEGLPVIAMEALCLGVPVLAPVPSVAEAFGQEICGLITENDTSSLEAGIKKMLTDEDFYAQAKAGAQKRSTFFDGRQMVRPIEELFCQLVEQE